LLKYADLVSGKYLRVESVVAALMADKLNAATSSAAASSATSAPVTAATEPSVAAASLSTRPQPPSQWAHAYAVPYPFVYPPPGMVSSSASSDHAGQPFPVQFVFPPQQFPPPQPQQQPVPSAPVHSDAPSAADGTVAAAPAPAAEAVPAKTSKQPRGVSIGTNDVVSVDAAPAAAAAAALAPAPRQARPATAPAATESKTKAASASVSSASASASASSTAARRRRSQSPPPPKPLYLKNVQSRLKARLDEDRRAFQTKLGERKEAIQGACEIQNIQSASCLLRKNSANFFHGFSHLLVNLIFLQIVFRIVTALSLCPVYIREGGGSLASFAAARSDSVPSSSSSSSLHHHHHQQQQQPPPPLSSEWMSVLPPDHAVYRGGRASAELRYRTAPAEMRSIKVIHRQNKRQNQIS
jgi:hypothetical protein